MIYFPDVCNRILHHNEILPKQLGVNNIGTEKTVIKGGNKFTVLIYISIHIDKYK